MTFECHRSWWSGMAHHVGSEGQHLMNVLTCHESHSLRTEWDPHAEKASVVIWPLGACVKRSSDPSCRRTTSYKPPWLWHEAASWLEVSELKRSQRVYTHYARRRFLVGRIAVGSQWVGTHTCWNTVAWVFPGLLGFLSASLWDPRLRNLLWPVQPGLPSRILPLALQHLRVIHTWKPKFRVHVYKSVLFSMPRFAFGTKLLILTPCIPSKTKRISKTNLCCMRDCCWAASLSGGTAKHCFRTAPPR